jgi:tetratricopeptide (TPR) repeat protein
VANIELRENLWGSGFSGTISPALSWLDQEALQQSAQGAMAAAIELRFLNVGMGRLIDSVLGLESELGFRLETQSRILESQLDVLARIEHALRRPGQVSAAERISNTGELLRRGRYTRALDDAEMAINDDPNNPAGFVAAGWALIGLGNGARARELFLEAADAADGDEHDTALRQAARIAFALEDGAAALKILDSCARDSSAFQRWATEYDRAVYLAASGDEEGAGKTLQRVLAADDRFAPMVVADQILNRNQVFCELAASVVRELTDALDGEHKELFDDLEAADEALASYHGHLVSETASTRDRLVASTNEIRDAVARTKELTSLRERLDVIVALRSRAANIHDEAAAWPAWAEAAFIDFARRDREQEAAVASAQLARDLANAAANFAAKRRASLTKEADGSWLITKSSLFNTRAWRARLVEGGFSIESIL